MARLPRLYVPGCSHHIVQRGNNRDVCFLMSVITLFIRSNCRFPPSSSELRFMPLY